MCYIPEGCKQRDAARNSFRGVLYKPTILLIQQKYKRERTRSSCKIRQKKHWRVSDDNNTLVYD